MPRTSAAAARKTKPSHLSSTMRAKLSDMRRAVERIEEAETTLEALRELADMRAIVNAAVDSDILRAHDEHDGWEMIGYALRAPADAVERRYVSMTLTGR